jgi:uncharacterized protein YndB with AHSA1/START domain
MKTERSVEIGRGRKAVWELMNDPSKLPEWFDDVDDFQALEGDGRSEGDKYRLKYMKYHRPLGLQIRVLEVEPQELFVQRFTGLLAPFTLAVVLGGTARKTTIEAVVDVKLSLLQKPFIPLVHGYVNQLTEDLTDSFKAYIEEGQ